ncbi:cadherin domain/calx-beta domain protein [alpha proteobacterium U9-1i]|nr:cadherin domain/calx-beta domain protein [alpha proteobacterium U9-1i]
MKRTAFLLAAALVALSISTTTPLAQESIPTGGISCGSADDAARRAGRAAASASDDWSLDNGGLDREFSGWIYRTPEGGYGYTDPVGGSEASADPRDLLDPNSPPGSPRLRTGEEVVGAYHNHPSGGPYDNEHFSDDDENYGEHHNVPVYVRTPRERNLRYDPSDDSTTELPEGSGGTSCQESDDELGDDESGWFGGLFGEPHLIPHDGGVFDFQAAGEFIAVQTPDGDLTIQARFEPYQDTGELSVMTALALRMGGQRIGVYSRQPHVLVDGRDVRERLGGANIGRVALEGAQIELNAGDVIITGPAGDRIRAIFQFDEFLDVYTALSPTRRANVSGLLGNFDGVREDQFVTRNNIVISLTTPDTAEFSRLLYREWGDSWRIAPEESLFDYVAPRNAASYDIRNYPRATRSAAQIAADPAAALAREACAASGVTERLLTRCVYDVVATGDERFIASYQALHALRTHRYIGSPGASFAFANFPADAPVDLLGDASFVAGALRLTPASGARRGGGFAPQPLALSRGFTSEFTLRITGQGGISDSAGRSGADGLAFVISGQPVNSLGQGGVALGYGGLTNALAIEFDTFRNVHDPSAMHVSVNRSRDGGDIYVDTQASIANSSAIPDLADGRPHRVRIDYAQGRLRVFIDNMSTPVIDTPLTLAQHVQLAGGVAWVGFTAGTDAAWEAHDITAWSVTLR